MTDSTLSTLSWSSLYQEQVTHHAAMLSSAQGSAPPFSVPTHHHPAVPGAVLPPHTVRQAAEQLLQPADRPVLGMLEVLAEIVRNEDMKIEDLTKTSNFNSSDI